MAATPSQLLFGDDHADAIRALESVDAGKGWCNVVPCVVDDVPDIKINFSGLWVKHGTAQASFVTALPRQGEPQPSSLGILHLRGRLGRDRIATLLGSAPFTLRQDHSQRGLLFSVPANAPASQVLDIMCTFTTSLCTYEMTGNWRLDLFLRR